VALFHNRPAGELVTYEELLAIFSDAKDPQYALWMAISRYNRQLEGAKVSLIKGQGYILTVVEDPDPMTKPSCFFGDVTGTLPGYCVLITQFWLRLLIIGIMFLSSAVPQSVVAGLFLTSICCG
jgi:hypothetical protein